MKALELASKVSVASAIIGNLPEAPGYNGSILNIDDTEAGKIEKDLDEAATELRRLAEVESELLEALAKVSTCISMHKRYKHIGDGYLEEAQEIIAKAKEQQ